MISLLLPLVFSAFAPLHISETELFQVMQPKEVFVQPNGEVYLLNFDESRIQHYGSNGALKGYIGSKGQGPGEFTFPTYITLMDRHLYVHDMLTDLVSIFDLNGNFVRTVRLPERGIELERSFGGWFFYQSKEDDTRGSAAILEWSDNHFESQEKVADIKNTGWGKGTRVMSDGKNVIASFSPLEVTPRMAVSPDGKRFYFADPFEFQIEVYDGTSAKHLQTITVAEKRIPFDEDWADEEYKEHTKGAHKQNPGVKIEKLFPKFFPAIRTMMFDPEGHLVVDRWRGRPDDNHYPISFDQQGKKIPLKYSWQVMRRLAGSAQGHAFIIMLEEEGEAGIAKVAFDQVDQFVKDHPVSDWSHHRSISITN